MNPLETCAREDILAVYLFINGPLGLSAGKIAAQCFQAAQRLQAAYQRGEGTVEQRAAYERWLADGTRTICRIAETPAVFDRICRELPGATMIDEGLTECPADSSTVHATWPIYRHLAPRLTRHKRAPLLQGPPITRARGA